MHTEPTDHSTCSNSLLRYALINVEQQASSPLKRPRTTSGLEVVRQVAWFLGQQPMLLTVNDAACGVNHVEMVYVFLQSVGFPDSSLFFRVLHYAGIGMASVLESKHQYCPMITVVACVFWLLCIKSRAKLLQAIFDIYDTSAKGQLSEEQITPLLQDLLFVGTHDHSGQSKQTDVLVSELLSELREYGNVLQECCSPASHDDDADSNRSRVNSTAIYTPRTARSIESAEASPIQREVFIRFLVKKRPSIVIPVASLQKQLHRWVEDISCWSADEHIPTEEGIPASGSTVAAAGRHLNTEVLELIEGLGYHRPRRASNERHSKRQIPSDEICPLFSANSRIDRGTLVNMLVLCVGAPFPEFSRSQKLPTPLSVYSLLFPFSD